MRTKPDAKRISSIPHDDVAGIIFRHIGSLFKHENRLFTPLRLIKLALFDRT